MNTKSSQNGGVPFSIFEWYFIVNCWFCAVAILYTALAESFGWRHFGSPQRLAFLVLVNGIILLTIQVFILSRRGRVDPLKSFHFRVPATLFAAASLVTVLGVLIHNA